VVVAMCSRCRHMEAVPLARLLQGRRGSERLVDLQAKLCWQCGNRVMNTPTIEETAGLGPQALRRGPLLKSHW
jgi:hypothetical protein